MPSKKIYERKILTGKDKHIGKGSRSTPYKASMKVKIKKKSNIIYIYNNKSRGTHTKKVKYDIKDIK